MVKKIFLFCPNKIDVYTVGSAGVIKIEVYEHLESRAVYIYYENSVKVYCGMSFIYDADHVQNPYGKKSNSVQTEDN